MEKLQFTLYPTALIGPAGLEPRAAPGSWHTEQAPHAPFYALGCLDSGITKLQGATVERMGL